MTDKPGYKFSPLVVHAGELGLTHLGHWVSFSVGRDTVFGRLIGFDRDTSGTVAIRVEGRSGQPTLLAGDELTFIQGKAGGQVF